MESALYFLIDIKILRAYLFWIFLYFYREYFIVPGAFF